MDRERLLAFWEVRWLVRRPTFLERVTAQSESGGRDFGPNGQPIKSPKGALYGMQVMPATARDPGFGIAPAKGDNPQEFNRVGREYLAMLHKRYGGDLAKMWAAYNAGPGNVDKALGKGANWLRHLPKETQNYVAANLAALRR